MKSVISNPCYDFRRHDPRWATPVVRDLASQVYGPSDASSSAQVAEAAVPAVWLAPVLADALEEAGCFDEKFLAALRDLENDPLVQERGIKGFLYASYPGSVIYSLAYQDYSEFDHKFWASWLQRYL